MILDNIANLSRYKGLSKALDMAIDSLMSLDFSSMSVGDYDLDYYGVYYMVQEPRLADFEDTLWEKHDKYIDIQYAFKGSAEKINYAPLSLISDWKQKEGTDTSFSSNPHMGLEIGLSEGVFAIFFPQEAHRPCHGDMHDSAYRKIVYKIPIA